jgi:hypothetical protein
MSAAPPNDERDLFGEITAYCNVFEEDAAVAIVTLCAMLSGSTRYGLRIELDGSTPPTRARLVSELVNVLPSDAVLLVSAVNAAAAHQEQGNRTIVALNQRVHGVYRQRTIPELSARQVAIVGTATGVADTRPNTPPRALVTVDTQQQNDCGPDADFRIRLEESKKAYQRRAIAIAAKFFPSKTKDFAEHLLNQVAVFLRSPAVSCRVTFPTSCQPLCHRSVPHLGDRLESFLKLAAMIALLRRRRRDPSDNDAVLGTFDDLATAKELLLGARVVDDQIHLSGHAREMRAFIIALRTELHVDGFSVDELNLKLNSLNSTQRMALEQIAGRKLAAHWDARTVRRRLNDLEWAAMLQRSSERPRRWKLTELGMAGSRPLPIFHHFLPVTIR